MYNAAQASKTLHFYFFARNRIFGYFEFYDKSDIWSLNLLPMYPNISYDKEVGN